MLCLNKKSASASYAFHKKTISLESCPVVQSEFEVVLFYSDQQFFANVEKFINYVY